MSPSKQLNSILHLKRRYLQDIERKAAAFGPLHMPTHLTLELEDLQREIAILEAAIEHACADLPSLSKSVFISYNRQDVRWLERLQAMLKPLMRNNAIMVWDDTNIQPGAKWREETQLAISLAKVAVLLVSPHYLASDSLVEGELTALLNAAEHQGLTIVWVAVSASMYKATAIANYRSVNDPERPLDTLSRAAANKALVKICEEVTRAVG